MQRLTRLAILAVTPLLSACTIIHHTHVAEGVSEVPYRDRQFRAATEIRLGFALDAFPTWAFDLSETFVAHPDRASYFEQKCFTYVNDKKIQSGCYPWITTRSSAVEVQKRWGPTRIVHPLATAMLGSVTTGNAYPNSAQAYSGVTDSARSSRFVRLGAGGELNLTSWLHVTATAGYLAVFQHETVNGTTSPSGFTLASLLVIGKPYRTP